jgi:integrase
MLEQKRAIVSYNASLHNMGFIKSSQPLDDQCQKQYPLNDVIDEYIAEKRKGILDDSVNEIIPCLEYLIECLSPNFPINNINNEHARNIKRMLIKTPTRRNTIKLTRGKPLAEQIKIAEDNNLDAISDRTVNKYLEYYSGLFKWASRNGYTDKNIFEGMSIRLKKNNKKREPFTNDQVCQIIAELEKDYKDKHLSKYWATMLAIYTGARRYEIAGLLPDEDADQRLKTKKAIRIIPIHSKLIELGLLEYIDQARDYIAKNPKTKCGRKTRLFYEMTHHKKEKWGRKFGYFVNNTLIKNKLKIKTDKLTLHSLRHSFITNLHQSGVPIDHIASMVGHEHGTITEKVYINWGKVHLPSFKESIEKLRY